MKLKTFMAQLNKLPARENKSKISDTLHQGNVTFQITEQCNLQCKYCYEHHKSPKTIDKSTAIKECQEVFRLIDTDEGILGRKNINGLVVSFFGGEPFLYPEMMDFISQFLIIGIQGLRPELLPYTVISLSTNGYNLDTPKARQFIEKYQDILAIALSFDGIKELHDKNRITKDGKGTFDKVFQNGLWLQKHGLSHIKMTFSKEDIPYIADSIIFFIENGFHEIVSTGTYEDVYNDEEAYLVYQQYRKVADYIFEHDLKDVKVSPLNEIIGYKTNLNAYPCEAFGNSICFSPDGKIYPCQRFCPTSLPQELSEQFLVGDCEHGAYEFPFFLTREKMDSITTETYFDQECKDCPISLGCGWCPGYCAELGHFDKRTKGNCKFHQAKVLMQYYYKNRRSIEWKDTAPLEINIPQDWALKIVSKAEFEELEQWAEKAKSEFERNPMAYSPINN